MPDKLVDPSARIFESPIGERTKIGEFCTVRESRLGKETTLCERISLKRVTVGDHCLINSGTYLENVKIGNRVMIAPNCSLVGVTHNFSRKDGVDPTNIFKLITIGDGAWIGANCVILPGVTIGEGAVIGAGAVVNMDIPSFHVYVGTPLKFKLYPVKE